MVLKTGHKPYSTRLNTAGLTHKIGSNQVRAIRILLTGTHEDMERITNDGRLDEWCSDNLRYLADTFGKENIVSAVLHMDEQTPHIHATLVPIVRGERKRRKREEQAEKRYRKKPTYGARLCADDIMTSQKLKDYQDSYAKPWEDTDCNVALTVRRRNISPHASIIVR